MITRVNILIANGPYHRQEVSTGGVSLGLQSAAGGSYRLFRGLEVYAGVECLYSSWSPHKGKCTINIQDGENDLPQMNSTEKEFTYNNSDTYSSNSAEQGIRQRMVVPLSSWGITAGLRFNFSHQ